MKRMLVIDPHLTNSAGHYLELALTALRGGITRGYTPCLFTAKTFSGTINDEHVLVERVFSHPKARKWSQTPEWYSRISRNMDGKPVGGNRFSRLRQRLVDRLHGPSPVRVVKQSCDELTHALKQFAASPEDVVLFTTTDDFLLVIYASAIANLQIPWSLNLAFLWHVPYQKGRDAEWTGGYKVLPEFKEQIECCVEVLKGHRVKFLATTQELERQLNASIDRSLWSRINYPIAPEFNLNEDTALARPYRMLMGGTQRTEKGKKKLSSTTSLLSERHLRAGRWQIGLQSTQKTVFKLLPHLKKLKAEERTEAFSMSDIILAEPGIDAEEYISWIKSADVGLFLYDARTYYTRCSGVLVEMLACGIPVLVPACSWLSRQIAPLMQEHLRCLSNTLSQRESTVVRFEECKTFGRILKETKILLDDGLTLDQSENVGILFEFEISGSTIDSYLSIEIAEESQLGNRTIFSIQTHELSTNGIFRLFVRAEGRQRTLRVSLSNPFPSPRLQLESAKATLATEELAKEPTSAVGIIYAAVSDLQRCFDELDDCMEMYQDSARNHAHCWREKHSREAFVDEILKD